jgi:glycerophosphoryl diester phosphodiesterase
MPTLEEALALAAELGLGANIEVKADRRLEYATAAAVADIVNRLGPAAPELLVSSFLSAVLAVLRDLAPQTPRGLLFRSVPNGWATIARRLDCVLIGADHRRLRPRRVAEMRAAGYPVAGVHRQRPRRVRACCSAGALSSVFSDMPDMMVPAGAVEDLTRPTLFRSPEAAHAHQGALQ